MSVDSLPAAGSAKTPAAGRPKPGDAGADRSFSRLLSARREAVSNAEGEAGPRTKSSHRTHAGQAANKTTEGDAANTNTRADRSIDRPAAKASDPAHESAPKNAVDRDQAQDEAKHATGMPAKHAPGGAAGARSPTRSASDTTRAARASTDEDAHDTKTIPTDRASTARSTIASKNAANAGHKHARAAPSETNTHSAFEGTREERRGAIPTADGTERNTPPPRAGGESSADIEITETRPTGIDEARANTGHRSNKRQKTAADGTDGAAASGAAAAVAVAHPEPVAVKTPTGTARAEQATGHRLDRARTARHSALAAGQNPHAGETGAARAAAGPANPPGGAAAATATTGTAQPQAVPELAQAAARAARGETRHTAHAGEQRVDAADSATGPGAAASTAPSAPASAGAASTPAAPGAGGALNAPIGSAAWSQALNEHTLRMHRFGDNSVKLTLHPQDLGQLQVSLKLGDQAQLHFASPHAHVRAAVEAALPQLRHAFADSGIQLGDTSVGDPSQHGGFGGGNDRRDGRGRAPDGDALVDAIHAAPTAGAPVGMTAIAGRTASGGIDLFA